MVHLTWPFGWVKRKLELRSQLQAKARQLLEPKQNKHCKTFSHAKELHWTAGLTRVTFAPQPKTSVYSKHRQLRLSLSDQPAAPRARWASNIPEFTIWPGRIQLAYCALFDVEERPVWVRCGPSSISPMETLASTHSCHDLSQSATSPEVSFVESNILELLGLIWNWSSNCSSSQSCDSFFRCKWGLIWRGASLVSPSLPSPSFCQLGKLQTPISLASYGPSPRRPAVA